MKTREFHFLKSIFIQVFYDLYSFSIRCLHVLLPLFRKTDLTRCVNECMSLYLDPNAPLYVCAWACVGGCMCVSFLVSSGPLGRKAMSASVHVPCSHYH